MQHFTSRDLAPNLLVLVGIVWAFGVSTNRASAQMEFEHEPINYSTSSPQDAVTALQSQLDKGEVELRFDESQGYLASILEALNIKPSSQVLVHSQTSFQLRRISPRRPRALYFNDESYVGWVQGGDVIEIMTTEPHLGQVFYTLDQEQTDRPRILRDQGQCMICHSSSRTQNVPGGLVRSVFVNAGGQPHYGSGTFNIDHSSPFEKRWGGWYVTGTHGDMRHMGNVISKSRLDPENIDREDGANVKDLSDRLDTEPYLTPHSDIVALMVLEHQTQMQNFITAASFENRRAVHHDGVMNSALDRPKSYRSESTQRRIKSAGDKLVRYMLFADEFRLTSPVEGSSPFTEDFQSQGPRDSQGRSLRDFDLKTRMFKYPCSYLIYSPAFDALPSEVKRYVISMLHEILTGKNQNKEFAYLSADDRKAILEILTETKPELWKDLIQE